MGSKPWIENCASRLLSSRKYRANEDFTISRGSRSVTGPIECGHIANKAFLYVGDSDTVRLDRQTLIDGVPAPDWRDTEQEHER